MRIIRQRFCRNFPTPSGASGFSSGDFLLSLEEAGFPPRETQPRHPEKSPRPKTRIPHKLPARHENTNENDIAALLAAAPVRFGRTRREHLAEDHETIPELPGFAPAGTQQDDLRNGRRARAFGRDPAGPGRGGLLGIQGHVGLRREDRADRLRGRPAGTCENLPVGPDRRPGQPLP